MKLRPYPKYKDSGIEWLGKIPEEWGTESLRRIGIITNGSTPDSTNEKYWNGNIVWFTPDDLGKNQTKYIRESKRKITVSGYKNCGTVIVPKNSLILSTRAPIGHLALTAVDACFNQGCKGIVFKNNFNPSFYYYYFLSIKGVLNAYGQGTTFFELGANKLAIIPVVIPPEKEKETIVNFLDQKTSKIDELTKKNERLIELLREKRQAIISQAVTKGLDPNVKMKDSGVEWLGKIPEGWEVQKLKHICNVKFSNVDKKSFGSERPVRLCNYVDVYNNDFITDEIEFMKATASRDEIAKFTLKKGDVIITKDSESWDDIAVPAYVFSNLEGVLCGYHLAHIRPDGRNIEGRYLLRAFVAQSINDQFRVSANGITRYGLSKHSIKSSLIPVPPNQEQIQIANYLDQKTTKIDGLIKKIKSQIEKLKEYRQTLISNVVTGKVRVSDIV